MKLRIASLSLLALCLTLAVVPAMAQTVYSNGPINGNTDAWTINFGFVVSDSFTTPGGLLINGLVFGAWAFPGDVLETAEVSITSSPFFGTTYTNQVVSFTQSGCSGNEYGFNVCTETGTFGTSVNLAAGTYWLNLYNAVVNDGDPIYWDENSGPSRALDCCGSEYGTVFPSVVGTIPSEAFTVLGQGITCGGGAGCQPQSVPEPSSLTLLSLGSVAWFGSLARLRRKLF